MKKIAYIRHGRDERTVLVGVSSEGETVCCKITAGEYSELDFLGLGCELSEEEFKILFDLDEKHRAMKKALSLLSYSDKNERTLFIRLRQAGFSRDAASEAVRTAVGLGYVDEERQLERLILAEHSKLSGRRLILGKLCAKGYKSADIERVTERLCEEGELDFASSFERLCEKRGAKSDEERLGLKYKYGY